MDFASAAKRASAGREEGLHAGQAQAPQGEALVAGRGPPRARRSTAARSARLQAEEEAPQAHERHPSRGDDARHAARRPARRAGPPAAPAAEALGRSSRRSPSTTGTFGPAQAERLLWRAGFGPRPGQAAELATLGLERRRALAHPPDRRRADGRPRRRPTTATRSHPLRPWGHDHLYWLDRMVRSRHQLVERLALVFHDWFATSNDARRLDTADARPDQRLPRPRARQLPRPWSRAITQDPAMLLFLDGSTTARARSTRTTARELMELFTLGADRGAYTETDVRELARSLSGWGADWSDDARRPQLPLGRAGPLGPGLQDRVRQDAARFTGRTPPAGRRAPAAPVVLRRASCGATSSRRRRTPRRRPRSRRSTSARATRSARCSRRSCARRSSTTGRGWSSRRSSSWPACCARRKRGITTNAWIWMLLRRRPAALLPARRLGLGRQALAGHQHDRSAAGRRS